MIKHKITKAFHRPNICFKPGEYFEEYMRFVDMRHGINWANGINQQHQRLPYHIVSIAEFTDGELTDFKVF